MALKLTEGQFPFNFTVFSVNLFCDEFETPISSKGLFLKDYPWRYPLPFFMLQFGLAILLLGIIRAVLKPLRQPRFVAEMLTGILLGPGLFELAGYGAFYQSLFNNKIVGITNLLEMISFATLSFIVGVRTDLSVLKTAGKRSWITGVLALVVPLSLTLFAAQIFVKRIAVPPMLPPGMTPEMFRGTVGIPYDWIAIPLSSTSFQVTSLLLEDLQLLNSEIGRLAMSCSLVSSLLSWFFSIYRTCVMGLMNLEPTLFNTWKVAGSEGVRIVMICVIAFVLRPIVYWVIRKVPEGKRIKETHFFTVFAMFLGVSFANDCLGYTAAFGAMLFGLAVPPGPPLASGLTERLEIFVSTVLLPAYILSAGRSVNFSIITFEKFEQCGGIVALAFLGKFFATIVPSVVTRMPYRDATTLGLVLNSQGLFDILFFKLYMNYNLITPEFYSIITVLTVVNAAIFTPIIRFLYDSSKRYVNYKRRTIQHLRPESEFRICLCVHEEDQVFSLMNVLKASKPTKERPIAAFVLQLQELVGRDHPLIINHQFHKERSSTVSRTDRIISAFDQYEKRNEGTIRHQHYTAIAPYATMHDDIYHLALQKSTSVLILPFDKFESATVRGVTRNVLNQAPCTVGLLVDKKIVMHWRSDTLGRAQFRMCVIFVGGPDSREALAYGLRMVENPAISLTVLRLMGKDDFISDMLDSKMDMKALGNLNDAKASNARIECTEVVVGDGAETSRVLMSLNDYDFFLVGRRFDNESQVVSGLTDWSYIHELGIIGDMLASTDMKCDASVLVLQQQITVEDMIQKA